MQAGTSDPQLAQTELITAIDDLNTLSGTTDSANLGGLTLIPGVYIVPGISNLTGTLTLDREGNANSSWVLLVSSTLITSPNSVINVIDTGSGAGVYWDVRSSATIGTDSTFLGNIVSLTRITMDTGVTDNCHRA